MNTCTKFRSASVQQMWWMWVKTVIVPNPCFWGEMGTWRALLANLPQDFDVLVDMPPAMAVCFFRAIRSPWNRAWLLQTSENLLLRSSKPGWNLCLACCSRCASLGYAASQHTDVPAPQGVHHCHNKAQILLFSTRMEEPPRAGAACWEPGRTQRWHMECWGTTQCRRIGRHRGWHQHFLQKQSGLWHPADRSCGSSSGRVRQDRRQMTYHPNQLTLLQRWSLWFAPEKKFFQDFQ